MSESDSATEITERRRVRRRRTLKEGRIVFANQSLVFDCVIRDLSDYGARLKLETTMDIPDEFTLVLVHLRQRVRSQVRWRTSDSLGVEFTGEKETVSSVLRI
ncbi:PilZ domain protein [Pseudovibrio axinellae]|uniref:PilZ domain protein n=1 Tax=Pseudovibrio axinellae TaxID=989403 RepID=A0A165UKP0_9HYPH|nr:PilZ domain-containing protein [Pseudovibrio axinellae]KZL12474.1 PilZ domain protein [Pseudovibrio axinellae]SEP70651.1 two-component system, cell cycle response regulator [Pseudovibrio axinellae]